MDYIDRDHDYRDRYLQNMSFNHTFNKSAKKSMSQSNTECYFCFAEEFCI